MHWQARIVELGAEKPSLSYSRSVELEKDGEIKTLGAALEGKRAESENLYC